METLKAISLVRKIGEDWEIDSADYSRIVIPNREAIVAYLICLLSIREYERGR